MDIDGRQSLGNQERPYHVDRTTSRPLCEVKRRRARLVLRWATTLEALVLFLFFAYCHNHDHGHPHHFYARMHYTYIYLLCLHEKKRHNTHSSTYVSGTHVRTAVVAAAAALPLHHAYSTDIPGTHCRPSSGPRQLSVFVMGHSGVGIMWICVEPMCVAASKD